MSERNSNSNGEHREPETQFIQPGIDRSGYTDMDAYVVGADSAEVLAGASIESIAADSATRSVVHGPRWPSAPYARRHTCTAPAYSTAR